MVRPLWALVLCATIAMTSCGRAADHIYRIVLENRSHERIAGFLYRDAERTMAGGSLAPGEIAQQDMDVGPIANRATLDMRIYPADADIRTAKPTEHHAEVLVRANFPARLQNTRTVWYFIIQPDHSLRVVFLGRAEFEALQAQGKRPG